MLFGTQFRSILNITKNRSKVCYMTQNETILKYLLFVRMEKQNVPYTEQKHTQPHTSSVRIKSRIFKLNSQRGKTSPSACSVPQSVSVGSAAHCKHMIKSGATDKTTSKVKGHSAKADSRFITIQQINGRSN